MKYFMMARKEKTLQNHSVSVEWGSRKEARKNWREEGNSGTHSSSDGGLLQNRIRYSSKHTE